MAEIRAGGIRVEVGLKLSTFEKDVNKLAKELNKVKKSFLDLGKNLSTTLTAPLAAVGTASILAAKSYSSAFKEMQRTTGATGQALKGFETAFRNVFTKGNRGPADVGLAITRVGIEAKATGKTLEQMATTILNLSTITGTELTGTLASTLDMLDNWNIANEEATSKLNTLYGVSQQTGVAVNDLADKLKIGGPILRALGVDFEQAASMVGLLGDKGLDVEKFFATLEKLPKKIKDTHDLGAAFDALIASAAKGDNADLMTDVIKGLGAKGSAQAVEALKLLRDEWQKTVQSVAKSGADINKTMADTVGIGDKLQTLKNVLTDALVPIGSVILDALKPALDTIKPYLESFASFIRSINPDLLKWAVGIGAVVAAIGPMIIVLGGIVGGARNLLLAFTALKPVFVAVAAATGLPMLKFVAIGMAIATLLKVAQEASPMIVAAIDAAFTSGVQTLLEFELALSKLDLKIAEWVDAATAKFRQFKNDMVLSFAVIKEKIGMAEEGSAFKVWQEQQVTSTSTNSAQARSLAHIAELQKQISAVSTEVAGKNNVLTKSMSDFGTSMQDLFSPITNLISGEKTLAETTSKVDDPLRATSKEIKKTGDEADNSKDGLLNFTSYLKDTNEDAKKAAEALENLRDRLAQTVNQSANSQIRDNLTKAIDSVDTSAFESLKDKYLTTVREGVLLGLKDSVEKAGVEGQALAQKIAAQEVYDEKIKLEEDFADRLKAKHKEAYEESVQFWRNTFENAITGETFNLKDALKQVAVGFGADIAASFSMASDSDGSLLSKILKDSKSPQDIGANLAKYLFGEGGKGGIFSNISTDSLDSFLHGTDVSPGGIWPEGTNIQMGGVLDGLEQLSTEAFAGANSLSAYASAAMASIESMKKLGKGTQEAADGVTEMAFTAAGAYFGGPVGAQIGAAIGDKVGDWVGGQFAARRDPEAIARHDITGKLEELIDKVGGLRYFDQTGQMHNVSNVVLGNSDKFNTPDWASNMWSQFGDQATQTFVGVGTALTDMFGIAEDVGSQIGNILIEQFNGDTEALKALVQTAGLTYDQFVNFLIDRGKQGQETWLAIIGEVNAGAEAFQEGLTGSGKYLQAFENLLNTAGRGQIALNQIRNIAIEGAEAGITSLEQLRAMLSESGQFTQQEVDALFAAFQSVGVDSLDKLKGATDLQLAQMVASMDAFFQDHGTKWSEATAEIAKYEDQLSQLEGRQVNIDINLQTHFDDKTNEAIDQGLLDSSQISSDTSVKTKSIKKLALGGVLTGPTFVAPGTLAGENGLEGFLPLKWMSSGKLGVSADFGANVKSAAGVSIYVDARGAETGVEQRLNSLFNNMEDRIVERSVSVILDSAQRGGLRGYF